jgi:hypothetical protein
MAKRRTMPQGRGYKVIRNGKPFVATLIKWVRMNDRASIAIFKVKHPKGTRRARP